MQILYGYYYLHHNANNYKGPDEAMSYKVDKSDITGTFYKNGLFIDELIQKFELYHNRFYMYSVTGNSLAWDVDEQLWSANNAPIVIPDNQSINVEFNFPLLFPNEFTTCFLGQMVERSETAPSDDFVYDQGYNSGYNVGYIEGVAITNDANATSGDMLSGKSAYVKGEKVVGTIPNATVNDVVSLQVETLNYHEAANRGYIQTKATISKNAYIKAGAKGQSINLRELEPTFRAPNIKKGVTMFGITGTNDDYRLGQLAAVPFYLQSEDHGVDFVHDGRIFWEFDLYNQGTYQVPYTGQELIYHDYDFIDYDATHSESNPLEITYINKHQTANVELIINVRSYISDQLDETFTEVLELGPGESETCTFEASDSDQLEWKHRIDAARFFFVEQ